MLFTFDKNKKNNPYFIAAIFVPLQVKLFIQFFRLHLVSIINVIRVF